MKPTAIFFDKDGTLMNFDAFWVNVTKYVLSDILTQFNHSADISDIDNLLNLLGVHNGETDIDGILCHGTYAQIAEVIHEFLKLQGIDTDINVVNSAVISAYSKNIDKGEIKPTCDNLKDTLISLKNKGISLYVITTDNPEMTHKCLETLGILDCFEQVFTDDGILKPKPDPECIDKYCAKTGTPRGSILMVGDTMTDMNFAKNASIRVAAVGNDKNRNKLKKYADAVIPDVSHIPEVI